MSDTYNTGLVDELDDEEKALFEGGGETPPAAEPEPKAEELAPEPKAEEPAAPEPKKEETVSEDDDGEEIVELEGNKGRFIRHGAFHRERKLRQAAEKERQELHQRIAQEQAERARINERLAILMQAAQPKQEKPVDQKVPNPEDDPFAYMRYLEGRLNQLGESTQQVGQRFQAQDEYSSARASFMADAQRFAAEKQDFMDAYNHLIQSRGRELALIGRTDPRERQAIIAQEEFEIVREALRHGRSPAELFYALAEDRGYRKAEPKPQEPAPAAQAPAAAAPAPAPAPKSAVEQVKAVAAAQAASKSLSSSAGGGAQPVTAESLANMTEDEFLRVYEKMSREQRRQYFGG